MFYLKCLFGLILLGITFGQNCCPHHKLGMDDLTFNCSDGSEYRMNCSFENLYRSDIDNFEIVNDTLIFKFSSGVHTISKGLFCIAKELRDGRIRDMIILCLTPEEKEAEEEVLESSCYLMASDVFLFLTFLIYLLLPSLWDLQGKIAMCFTGSLFLAIFFFAFVQQSFFKERPNPDLKCIFGGYLVYYWIMASFIWLLIIAFNLWRQVVIESQQDHGNILWLIYSVCAFGIPLVSTTTLFVFQNIRQTEALTQTCLFQGKIEAWIFLCAPIILTLVSCSILFALSFQKTWPNYTESSQPSRIKTLQYQLRLYFMLFLIMGLIWMYEIFSFTFEESWFTMEIVLSLQGFLIFLVMALTHKNVIQMVCLKTLSASRHAANWEEMGDSLESGEDERGF